MNELTIALVGNPNSGKTTLFNELTGANQYVGNWPGVTVERKLGKWKKAKHVAVQDLPGIYSLAPYTPEEIITRDYLIEHQPDCVLNIIDATNLERNLYLTTQLLELEIPVIVALNMMDILKKEQRTINIDKLAYSLDCPALAISALKKSGLSNLGEKMLSSVEEVVVPKSPVYDAKLESALQQIQDLLVEEGFTEKTRWYAIKLFERDQRVEEQLTLSPETRNIIEEIITITEKIFGDDSESIIINERYEWIGKVVSLAEVQTGERKSLISDKIDRVVTNRFLALPIFAFVMWLVYFLAIQTVGTMGTDWLNDRLFGEIVPDFLANVLNSWHIEAWLQHLILDGIVAGIGAVLGFLPQLIVLFLCLSFLEYCGYMARIAFIMDRFFRKFGLSGKSFIPMLIATGCGVPGIMASRTIENEEDRRMTVMITTFMPCSAKLPIISLIAGAFFPTASWVAPSAYFVGIAAIIISGIILKKTKLFAGDPAPFIMELPTYHLPHLKNMALQTFERSKAFVKKAGTIIFVSSIFIWFLLHYNFALQEVSEDRSMLAGIGNLFAGIFAPLGFGNWRATVGTFAGLVAKENVVNTFGILYGGLKEVSENGKEVWPLLHASFTPVAGYSFLLFNLLCAPCFAAIGAMRRELVTWKWTGIAVGYQCGLAYVVSFITYQLGSWLFEGRSFSIGQILALIAVGLVIFALVYKPKRSTQPVEQLIQSADTLES